MAFISSGSLNTNGQCINKPGFWLTCDTLSGSSEGALTKQPAIGLTSETDELRFDRFASVGKLAEVLC